MIAQNPTVGHPTSGVGVSHRLCRYKTTKRQNLVICPITGQFHLIYHLYKMGATDKLTVSRMHEGSWARTGELLSYRSSQKKVRFYRAVTTHSTLASSTGLVPEGRRSPPLKESDLALPKQPAPVPVHIILFILCDILRDGGAWHVQCHLPTKHNSQIHCSPRDILLLLYWHIGCQLRDIIGGYNIYKARDSLMEQMPLLIREVRSQPIPLSFYNT